MMTPVNRFYCEESVNEKSHLSEKESRHATRVLRLKKNDQISVTDGKGGEYVCRITDPNPRKCEFSIIEKIFFARHPYYIHLGIAPTKNIDRIEWMVEKCTEIGIDEISFFIAEHSERKDIKIERMHKKVISALTQSGNHYLPVINKVTRYNYLIDNIPSDYQKFIAFYDSNNSKTLFSTASTGGKYTILIGPEGDFTSSEVEFARQRGFMVVSLGSSRLRTETAGLVACATLNLLNQQESVSDPNPVLFGI